MRGRSLPLSFARDSRRLLLPMLLVMSLAGGWLLTGCRSGKPRPSILLIVIDTLRADHVGLLSPGGPAATPNLDRRFRSGTAFRNAGTPAPFTMPAVASLLTGVYPDRTGVVAHEAGTSLATWTGPTLAEHAVRAGLATAAVVANPWLARRNTGFDRGFEKFSRFTISGRRGGSGDADSVTDEAIRHLDGFGDRPFLLWVHYFDPHMPYEPPADFAAAAGAAPGTNRVVDDFLRPRRNLRKIYSGQGYAEPELEQTRRLYAGEVRFVDAQVERLLSVLDSRGLTENTLVVVASDHGEGLGEHGLYFAHDYTLYEELTRVALMLRGPGVPPGSRDDPVSLLDVEPTLCRLAKLDCTVDPDGRDLFSTPTERTLFAAATASRVRKSATFDRLTVAGLDGRWTMARRGNLKRIRIPTPKGEVHETYDLASDPLESEDLSADAHGDAQDLGSELSAWSRRMNALRPAASDQLDPREQERANETLRSLGYLQ